MASFDSNALDHAKANLNRLSRIRDLIKGDPSKLDAQLAFYEIKQEAHLQNCAFLKMLEARPELNNSLTQFANPAHCGKLEHIIRINVNYNSTCSLSEAIL